jgi:hypothetical protein
MRILVADKNAPLLAAITATFGRHCDLVTTTHRDSCLEQIERQMFDVVVACDNLADYTGLELLSEVASASPGTLLIFVASAERLKRLGPRLALFGLFQTLSYPLTARKLLDSLKLARLNLPQRAAPKVRHVVLESEWDTGERLGLIEQQLDAEAGQSGTATGWPTHHTPAQGNPEESKKVAAAQAASGRHDTAGATDPGVSTDEFVFSAPSSPSAKAARAVTSPTSHPTVARPIENRVIGHQSLAHRPPAKHSPATDSIAHRGMADHAGSHDVFANSVVVDHAIPDGAIADCVVEVVHVEPVPVAAKSNDVASSPASASTLGTAAATNEPTFDRPEGTSGPVQEAETAATEVPQWVAAGAANDSIYDVEPATPTRARNRASVSAKPSPPARSSHASQSVRDSHAVGSSHPTQAPQVNSAQKARSSQQPAQAAARAGQPRSRVQAVPTDAHRAAFERAVARRNAERDAVAHAPLMGGKRRRNQGGFASAMLRAHQISPEETSRGGPGRDGPSVGGSNLGSLFAESPRSPLSSQSLSQLARMAVNKRPLAESMANYERMVAHKPSGIRRFAADSLISGLRPKRAVFALGSGLAAVLVIGVLSFVLLRTPHASAQMPHAPRVNRQVFSASSAVTDGEAAEPAPFSATPAQPSPEVTANANQEAPQFNPDTAPPDPPPPPALETPGPMEPPSAMHVGPPLGMVPPGFEPQPE